MNAAINITDKNSNYLNTMWFFEQKKMIFLYCPLKTMAWQVKENVSIPFIFYFFLLASHLCDTRSCILKDHVVLEAFKTNNSRTKCAGIILTIREQTATSPAHILKATPCQHGLNHIKSNGNHFMFSCRKIQFFFWIKLLLIFSINKNENKFTLEIIRKKIRFCLKDVELCYGADYVIYKSLHLFFRLLCIL